MNIPTVLGEAFNETPQCPESISLLSGWRPEVMSPEGPELLELCVVHATNLLKREK